MLHCRWHARLAGLAASLALAAAAHAGGVITVVDGAGTVWREQQRFALAEGLRVQADDVLSTGDSARLVRVELDDGRVLDLGPGTQALLQPAALARDAERAASAYLLQGWLKITSPAAQPAVLAGPRLDLRRIAGSAIVAAPRAQAPWLHIESGSAQAVAHEAARRAPATPLSEAQVYTLRGAGHGEVAERLSPAQRALLPRSFVDGVPRRAAGWGTATEPGPATPVAYEDAAPWMHGEAALRPSFVGRLAPRLKDPGFRKAVLAEMRQHPEWQRLFPPPPAPPRAALRPAPAPKAFELPMLPPPDEAPASDVRAEVH